MTPVRRSAREWTIYDYTCSEVSQATLAVIRVEKPDPAFHSMMIAICYNAYLLRSRTGFIPRELLAKR